jgi:lipopolysaccharide export system protein LptA
MNVTNPVRPHHRLTRLAGLALCAVLCSMLAAAPAVAEKGDRSKPIEIQADTSGTTDLLNQVSRFNGHVVITQGTLVIKADRVEIRHTPDGYYLASAWGNAAAQVSFRQKRDDVDEYIEGRADRVEFDGKADLLRMIGRGTVRRTQGARTLDEITGALITWNNATEQFSAQSGATAASSADSRVRAVLSPRAASQAASQPAR